VRISIEVTELTGADITYTEQKRRDILKVQKPRVYEKVTKFKDKIENGESIAIIQLQYNYMCNMRCEHCAIERMPPKLPKRRLTPDDVSVLARQADEMGLARFVLTGGEPLTFPDLDELVTAIDPGRFYINCDSNGWLLEEKAAHLKEIGIDRIQLSIDSLNPDEHDAFRRKPGSFARALKGMEECLRVGLPLYIQTVVTKERLYSEEFINFLKFFNEKGLNVFVSYAKPVGAWEGHFDNLINRDDMAYMRELEKKHQVCTHLTPGYGLDMGCIAVKGMISVTEYGDVLPCPYIHTSIGNIFEDSLADIIKRGLDICHFGEYRDTCLIAEDIGFIKKYVAERIYNRPIPVPCAEVFAIEDRTVSAFKGGHNASV
jgi:MoaA/NifB/PqqE/SkfB family radical SAM enzyme